MFTGLGLEQYCSVSHGYGDTMKFVFFCIYSKWPPFLGDEFALKIEKELTVRYCIGLKCQLYHYICCTYRYRSITVAFAFVA